MVKTKEDLTGKIFGRLTVISRAPNRVVPSGQQKAMWWCKCSCGNPDLKAIDAYSLTHHRTESCGCIQKEIARARLKKSNTYDLTGEYGIGYTSKEEPFFFDLEDYDTIKDYTWFIGTGKIEGYVVSGTKNRQHVLMHRVVMNYDGPCDIDHIHGKETRNDNRKCNLRIATRSQNNMNKGVAVSNTGIIGIHQLKHNNKFRAYIGKDGVNVNLGDFDNLADAVLARKNAEEDLFKEYAYTVSQTSGDGYANPNNKIGG
jgi:hypothetical protein